MSRKRNRRRTGAEHIPCHRLRHLRGFCGAGCQVFCARKARTTRVPTAAAEETRDARARLVRARVLRHRLRRAKDRPLTHDGSDDNDNNNIFVDFFVFSVPYSPPKPTTVYFIVIPRKSHRRRRRDGGTRSDNVCICIQKLLFIE